MYTYTTTSKKHCFSDLKLWTPTQIWTHGHVFGASRALKRASARRPNLSGVQVTQFSRENISQISFRIDFKYPPQNPQRETNIFLKISKEGWVSGTVPKKVLYW